MAEGTVREFIESYNDPHFYGWIIESEGVPAGTIGAYDYEDDSIEVGFCVDGDFRGHGFAGEALKTVIRYLTENEGIGNVTAWCASDNIASARTLEKAGMKSVGTTPGGLKVGDAVYDRTDYVYEAERSFDAEGLRGAVSGAEECPGSKTASEPGKYKYMIFDPTGNITALVKTYAIRELHPAIASEIMKLHPEVEQVGFFCTDESGDAVLRMAGGEFCGNASMCAAVMYAKGKRLPAAVSLKVSGTRGPVTVDVLSGNDGIYRTSVVMPPARSITEREFEYGNIKADLPVVEMEGISHIIIEKESPFYALLNDRNDAEDAVKKWCGELSAKGLGLMFIQESENCNDEDQKKRCEAQSAAGFEMAPLVYIPGADSMFWENSCASGSAAAGMYFASLDSKGSDCGSPETKRVKIAQPGGVLCVECSSSDRIKLFGSVKYSTL